MADTLTRRSPLQDWKSRFAAPPASVHIDEEPFVSMIDLWVDPSGPGGPAAADALGIDALPTNSAVTVPGSDSAVIWFGPQEWLVTSAGRQPEAVEALLREAVADHGGAAVDVSAQRTTIRLRGEHARAVLAKGCSVDLHPSVFAAGATAQTVVGLAAVVVTALDGTGTDYRILVRSSFAGHLADWLIDAAEEFGIDW